MLGSSPCGVVLQGKHSPTFSGLSGLSKALVRDKSLTTSIYILSLLHPLTFFFYNLPSFLVKLAGCHSGADIFLGFTSDIIKITFGYGYVIPLARSIPALKIPLRRS